MLSDKSLTLLPISAALSSMNLRSFARVAITSPASETSSRKSSSEPSVVRNRCILRSRSVRVSSSNIVISFSIDESLLFIASISAVSDERLSETSGLFVVILPSRLSSELSIDASALLIPSMFVRMSDAL